MSSSVGVITAYLSESQKHSLAKSLASNLKEIESVNTLCDILDSLSEDIRNEILPTVFHYCLENLKEEKGYDTILSLLQKFKSPLISKVVNHIVQALGSFTMSSIVHFDKEFQSLIKTYQVVHASGMKDVSSQEVISILKFLEQLFMSIDNVDSTELDFICCYYLAINDNEISALATRLIRWRIKSILKDEIMTPFIWDMIFLLQESHDLTKINNGFILWLRVLSSFETEQLMSDASFQTLMKSRAYWSYLRNGLVSDAHEHRKYSISVLQLSIRAINSNLENDLMSWKLDEADLFSRSWKRFITLFEIIGIDTSLNQAQDAAGEMIGLLSSDSKIPVPFTLSLLSIGFKASMETVRKFAMKLIFAIPVKNLRFLSQDGFVFLKDHFLKFAMIASNFTVYKDFTDAFKGNYNCEFGESLSKFITNCFQDLNFNEAKQLASKLIELLSENRDAFDPSKTYISLGLLRGLKSRKFEILGVEQLKGLHKMFESHSDGEVFNTTLQTINLRLLLYTDHPTVSLNEILLNISKFIQFNNAKGLGNGYTIYGMNLDYFLDYFSINYTSDYLLEFFNENSNNLDTDPFVILLSLISSKKTVSSLVPKILAYPNVDELLTTLTASMLPLTDILNDPLIQSRCGSVINELGNGVSCNLKLYENSTELVNNNKIFDELYWDKFDVSILWMNILEDLDSEDEVTLRQGVSKLKFFSNVISKSIFNEFCERVVTFENLQNLQTKAFKNASSKIAIDFYKTKDLFLCHLYEIALNLTKIVDVESNKYAFFELIEHDVDRANRKSMLSIIKLLSAIYDKAEITESDTSLVLNILKVFWDDIISDRLVLGQKELHLHLIKLLFHEKNLLNSKNDKNIQQLILKIGIEIIETCHSRKALLPTLVKSIATYQVKHIEEFEETYWIMEILARAYFMQQSTSNLFKSEYVIGDIYDSSLSLYYGEKLYTKIYGDEEISSKVNVNVIIASIANSKAGEYLWEFILNNDKELRLLTPKNRADGYEEWKRIQILQLLLLSIKTLSNEYLYETVSSNLVRLIFKDPSPLCRMYIEWITAYTLWKSDARGRGAIFEQFQSEIKKQQQTIVTSFERISYLFAQQLSPIEECEFLSKFLVEFLLPSCSSNRSLIRHFSVSLVVSIYPEVQKKNLKLEHSLVETLKQIHSNALRTENYQSYRSGDALLWNIEKDFNLVGICGGVLLRISDREIDFIDEQAFLKYTNDEQRKLLKIDIGKDEQDLFLSHEARINKPVMDSPFVINVDNDDDDEETALQTKSGAWSTVMNLDANNKVKRSPLIVVSSLVDKVVNLGAICRLCDCLGVGLMTVNDISVQRNTQFKTVAVTAEQWMPMIQVKIDEIIEFLRFQKKQGYTLIGLEQTDQSVELNSDLKFPEKTLILVGKEREGVPGELLAELDLCVEIKQAGVIRSMNIQTATAIICHSYSIQHI